MTDKELLELAAKAAGLEKSESDGVIYAGFGSREWNPLTDDGDALRLAVKLRLNVNIESTTVDVYDDSFNLTRVWGDEIPDAYVATRRAIVRAAAEIGKESK